MTDIITLLKNNVTEARERLKAVKKNGNKEQIRLAKNELSRAETALKEAKQGR